MTRLEAAWTLAYACFLAGCGVDEPLRPTPSFDPHVLASPEEARDLDPDPSIVRYRLRAAPAEHRIGDEIHEGYAYNGQLPGPTLRASVGDTLVVELENALDFATTIHWHGLAVPYEMDGVTWQREPVSPGESFTYSFPLTRAGTFWYHPHFDSERQVDRGLYGALVVEDPAEPELEELVLVFDSWGETEDGAGPSLHAMSSQGPRHAQGGAAGALWTVNARIQPLLPVVAGTALRVRIVNASSNDYLSLSWPEMRVIAADQGLLPALVTPESVLLAPGDRAEAEWLLGPNEFSPSAAPYSIHGGAALGSSVELFHVVPQGDVAAPSPRTWPFSNQPISEDPGFTDVVYVFTGDPLTNDWRINGELFPDVTVASLGLGTDAVIEVRNASATEHPFHLHGHAFEIVASNGVAPELAMFEDTINVRIGESARLRFVADNPGEWMAHCHILAHAEGGMMTVLRVEP
jgi:FtsP/CotA-like multicopper oxidase with cupredoxin domain